MKVSENSDEIVIRHLPVGEWISSGILIFIFGAFGLWVLYFGFINPHGYFEGYNTWLTILLVSVCAALILIAVFEVNLISMIRAPLMIVTVCKKTESVDILRRRFYGVEAQRFYFYQIEKFKSYKNKTNFSSRYFLALILANQKVIKLDIPIGGDKQKTIRFVKKLNKFVKTNKTALVREDESE